MERDSAKIGYKEETHNHKNPMYTPPQSQTIETKVAILEEKLHTTEQLMQRIESAIEKMSEVSANVTKMLAVHEQKIDGNDKVDAILFAKIDQLSNKMDTDHNIVLDKLQGLEKKVWIGIGIFAVVTLIINNSEMLASILTSTQDNGRIERLR
jgi:hypothetical protein